MMGAALKPESAASRLTPKQREVLELVLDRRTNKEIAHLLGVSDSAVEQRLQSARLALGAANRAEAARIYARLNTTCGETTGEKFQVHTSAPLSLSPSQADAFDPVLSLSDSMPNEWGDVPWNASGPKASYLETLDAKFGVTGRVGLIVGLTAAILLVLLVMVSLANAIDTLL